MSELLWTILGFVLSYIVTWLLAKINPNAFAKLVSRWLGKIVRSAETRNKIENAVGDTLIEIGKAIKEVTPDQEEDIKKE